MLWRFTWWKRSNANWMNTSKEMSGKTRELLKEWVKNQWTNEGVNERIWISVREEKSKGKWVWLADWWMLHTWKAAQLALVLGLTSGLLLLQSPSTFSIPSTLHFLLPSHLSPEVMTALISSQAINSGHWKRPASSWQGLACWLSGCQNTSSFSQIHTIQLGSYLSLVRLQMTTVLTPSRPIKLPECTVTWTWCTRTGSPPGNRRL